MQPYQINPEVLQLLPGQGFERPRGLRIYKAPLVIATRGLPQRGFYAAFCTEDVLYPEVYFGISIPRQQLHLAHYLNGILNSSLATYFLFLTASAWGVERDEVKPEDLKPLPIPTPVQEQKTIVDCIIETEELLRQSPEDSNWVLLQKRLNNAVFDLYGLDETERILVEDTVNLIIDLKMKREKSPALKYPKLTELETYSLHLIDVIQPFLKTLNERKMVADVFNISKAPLQVVKFSIVSNPSHRPVVQTVEIENLEAVLEGIARQLPQRIADRVYTRRNLRIYAGDDLYVVKPAQRRYWSRSAGLNDADMIIAEHLGTNRDSIK